MSAHKLQAGAVYRMEREDGSTEEFVCWAVLDRRGERHAWIQRFGFARQMVAEGTEFTNQMKLVRGGPPKPAAKKAPVKKPAVKKPAVKKSSPKRAAPKASK